MYPNPAGNIIYVEIPKVKENLSLELYNSMGSLIYKKNITEMLNSIDLSNQSAGVYYVDVMNNGINIATKKIVKE